MLFKSVFLEKISLVYREAETDSRLHSTEKASKEATIKDLYFVSSIGNVIISHLPLL